MSSFFLTYANSRFHAISEGHGEELLICLHGFGENANSFSKVRHTLGQMFTIVALDMPMHGKTEWKENRQFTPEDLQHIIRLLLEQQGQHTFSLMGYSMGARAALCTIPAFASQVERLYLLAPDGLRNNPWHMFVTQTTFGNRLFKYCTYRPKLYFGLLHLWHKLGFLNASLYRFAYGSMNTLEKRERVYFVWTCMRQMMPDKKQCKELLRKYKVKTLLIFGKYDRVIPPVLGVRFMDGTFPCKMLVIERGHQLLSEELGEAILDNYE